MYDAINSKYTYKESDVLKNKLDIKDEKKLKEYETEIVAVKLAILIKEGCKKTFDEEHLKYIHYFLFSDVYDFAGKYREENITKENFLFSDFKYIEENIKIIFKKIDLEKWRKLEFEELVKIVSEIMTDLNVLHPFREGNGRATREFIRELLFELGYEINFFNVDYKDILSASIKAVINDHEQIELLMKNIKIIK